MVVLLISSIGIWLPLVAAFSSAPNYHYSLFFIVHLFVFF